MILILRHRLSNLRVKRLRYNNPYRMLHHQLFTINSMALIILHYPLFRQTFNLTTKMVANHMVCTCTKIMAILIIMGTIFKPSTTKICKSVCLRRHRLRAKLSFQQRLNRLLILTRSDHYILHVKLFIQ